MVTDEIINCSVRRMCTWQNQGMLDAAMRPNVLYQEDINLYQIGMQGLNVLYNLYYGSTGRPTRKRAIGEGLRFTAENKKQQAVVLILV